MNKYKIELTEEQMRLVSNCLEDVSRFAGGQWEMRFLIDCMIGKLHQTKRMYVLPMQMAL